MFFKILINYIFGYLNIQVEGYYVERFINNCISKGIFLWNTKRTRSAIITSNLGAEDFKKAAKIAKKHGCRIKINDKHGMPFVIKKYKKRKLFFILLFIVILAIYTLSRFVWNIEIKGIENINQEEIIKALEDDGLKVGTLKSKVDTNEIISKIRYQREDIAWIGINLDGTNAIVEIVEADKQPEIIDDDDYCNIVAQKDGKIEKISAQNGTLMVSKGQEVKKGDILIAGYMEGKYTGKNYVNANGKVTAIVKYSQTEKIGKKEIKREKTENYENKYSIKINNFKINLYKTLSKYKNYDTIYTNKKLKLFSNFYLPIELIKTTNYEVIESEISYDKNTAKVEGQKRAEEKLDKLVTQGEIANKIIDVKENETSYEVTVTYEVLEEIGTKEKIVF